MVFRVPVDWLLNCDEPWTRYRTRIDLLEESQNSPAALQDRKAMISHPLIKILISRVASWPGEALKRHNDARHPLQSLAVIGDLELQVQDIGRENMEKIITRQSPEGAFETMLQLYRRFGGLEGEHWTWMGCDAPVVLYFLLTTGLNDHAAVLHARDHLVSLGGENGWSCSASPMLGNFKGPGKRDDPCPLATLLALKALSTEPSLQNHPVVRRGQEMLLHHWEIQQDKKYFLFGIGTDFRKVKYPLIWYDLLHVCEVLSRFPLASQDPRFDQILGELTGQLDDQGRLKATSMYRAWKEWSFADKKSPSPWLTFMAARILKRVN